MRTALVAAVELTEVCSNVLAMACGLSARLNIIVDGSIYLKSYKRLYPKCSNMSANLGKVPRAWK